MSESVERLKEARALISDPEQWVQQHMALNAQGCPCPADDPDAVCWCLFGAITKVCEALPGDFDSKLYARVDVAELLYGILARGVSVMMFNDNSTHAEVLELCDEAIALGSATTAMDEGGTL
jgi:hypothetical protein